MKKDIKELIGFSKSLKVLVVEDNDEAREQAIKLLSNLFDNIIPAVDGKDGLTKFKNNDFDLIVSDLNMPKMNGIEMCTEIRKVDKDIPIVILSAYNDTEYFMNTIKLGISGYVLKPINLEHFLDTLYGAIEKIQLRDKVIKYKQQLESINKNLEDEVIERIGEVYALNSEIEDTQKEVIFTLAAVGETRSKETGNHVKRVAAYSKLLAKLYGLSEKESELISMASPMHDIGKVGIPDAILNKDGKHTMEEKIIMETHAKIGYEMLKSSKRPILKAAAIISYQHHEKYDGTGYPQGLKGEDIDIYGRITAIADVFDALGSDRAYKKAWEDEKIFTLFKQESGKHFDPKLIDIFFDNLDQFFVIRNEFE